MRRITGGVVVVCLLVGAVSVYAAPRERTGPHERSHPIVKAIKKIVKTFGDGLTIPGGKS